MQIKFILLLIFLSVLDPGLVCAQVAHRHQPTVSITSIRSAIPAANAHIVKFYVDEPSPNSHDETGNLRIIYSDNTKVIVTLHTKDQITANNVVENQEGIVDPRVAQDQRSIAWTEMFDVTSASYSVPLGLAIYNSGKSFLHIQQGQMIWYWAFLDGGKHVAVVWGAMHGPEVGDYQLYDTNSGHLLSQVYGDTVSETLGLSAPEWAKKIERQMHLRK